jgi:hypothetical protein
MAYNVLKGNVQFINSDTGSIESMVDDYSNQTIAGIKTFSSAITASLGLSSSVGITAESFTGAGTGISGVTATGVSITNDADNRVLTAKGDSTLQAEQSLTFDGSNNLLTVAGNITASINISGSEFYGSATGLTSIPTNQFASNISAANINLGNGVENDGGNLAAKVSGSGGLALGSAGLSVSPNSADSISGGSLAGADEFLVADNNLSNALKKATITNLQTYMQSNLSFGGAAGSQHQIQFRDGAGSFAASSDLTFNDTTDILTVNGQLTASTLVSSSQVYANNFYGNGNNLTNLTASELVGLVSAANINIGNGLFNDSNKLAVSASLGLVATSNGLEVTASSTSGLDVGAATGGIVVSPSRATAKGSPVAADIILIGDSAASNQVKNTTLENVVTLVQNNGAGGSNTQVQFNSSNAFTGDNAFTFNASTNTLLIQEISSSGNISASFFYGDGSNLQNVGGQSAFNDFTADFTVALESDILGIVTTGSAITASFALASQYGAGQRFTFKDVSGSCSGSNHIVITTSGGQKIDGQSAVKIQTGYGAVTIASDGAGAFYIVGTN